MAQNRNAVDETVREGWALSLLLKARLQSDLGHKAAEDSFNTAQELTNRSVNEQSNVPAYREQAALVLSYRAQHAARMGAIEEAQTLFDDAIERFTKLAADYPEELVFQHSLIQSQWQKGVSLVADRPVLADVEFRKCADGWRQLVQSRPQSEVLVKASQFLLLCPREEFRDSKRAVELAREVTTQVASNAAAWNVLALGQSQMNDLDGALSSIQRAQELRPIENAFDWYVLARIKSSQGEFDDASAIAARGQKLQDAHRPFHTELTLLRSMIAIQKK